jgi:hypothetical protein
LSQYWLVEQNRTIKELASVYLVKLNASSCTTTYIVNSIKPQKLRKISPRFKLG